MVNWTSDKDQIILKGIFKFHDIKSSAPLLEYLAQEIGGDCTPKAVSHRLSNIRKSGTATGSPTKSSSAGIMKSPSTPKTPRFRGKKATSHKKKDKSDGEDHESMYGLPGNDDHLLSPTAARRKRQVRKTSYAESDAEDGDEEDVYVPNSKVKAEAVEEEDPFAELSEEAA